MSNDDAKLIEAVQAVATHGNVTAAAKELGVARSTLQGRCAKAKTQGITAGEAATDNLTVEENPNKTELIIRSLGPSIKTADDAIKYADIDLRLWEVDRTIANAWTVTMKVKGKDGSDTPAQVTNWKIEVRCRRRAPKHVQDGIVDLLSSVIPLKLEPVKLTSLRKHPHLLELSLYDAHFGKLCFSEETGTEYNIEMAESIYLKAVDELLDKCVGFDVEKVLFPIGNDFFNVNNWSKTTKKGTPQDEMARFHQTFKVGCRAVAKAILRCREVAAVDLIWIPGNHDQETSWYMMEYLDALFNEDFAVTVDTTPKPRKYVGYGVNAFMFTHGNEEKHADLPLIMFSEGGELVSNALVREIHHGHFHRQRETRFVALNENCGVVLRALDALSATDRWHFAKGYVKSRRAAKAFLWGKTADLIGENIFSAVVKDSWLI